MTELTPAQSADVIQYLYRGENDETRRRGWKDRVSIGHAAIRATRAGHSPLPDARPLLTLAEMSQGLASIDGSITTGASGHDDARLDHLADTRGISYEQARRLLALEPRA